MKPSSATRNSRPTDAGRRQRSLAALLVVLQITVAGPAAAADDRVIAQVGDQTLTVAAFRRLIATLDPDTRRKATQDRAALLQWVRAELGRRAVLDAARRRHWDRQPAVAARAEQAREDVIITSFLTSTAMPPPGFPPDDAIRRVYDANLSRFMQPRRYHVAHIFVARPDQAKSADLDAARHHAADLAASAQAPGADFAALARRSSEDTQSARQGGDLGWVAESQMLPEIARTLAGMRDGEVSGPVEVADGWHILREIATRAPAPAPLDQVRPAIVGLLRDAESARLGQSYVADLLAHGHAEVDLDAVRALLDGPAASSR